MIIRLEMKNYNTILIDKQKKYQHDHEVKLINEYLTGKDILPSNQNQIIEQAKFTYSSLGKALEKQTKTIENAAKNKQKSLKNKS